ncbi:hypothetical protein FLONG3_2182 [Fusarium longipes]|uniref:Uncharacterized protein n=1 Tax=Fusarium longipes TaxID=694270 RepID=A0A395T4V5_9HYPO|nr:hypothetical protein FLONG3_2182 [Fusarium longipes]
MCKYYVYDYESCRHNKLLREERCLEDQVNGYCFCLPLSSWLYPNSTHRKVTVHTTMRGLCHECDNRQRSNNRRDYGNFNSQSAPGVRQTQASDYSCGGLNESPVRAPDRSYQPGGYRAEAQMSYSSPQPRAPGSSQTPSYGYARRLHRDRFVGQPSRLQASNRQNSNGSTSIFSEPSPYELQVYFSNSDNSHPEDANPRAGTSNEEPSPYELQVSLGNSDGPYPENGSPRATTSNSSSSARRGNMDIMDRLPRPAPESSHSKRRPVPRRVAALRGERSVKPSKSSSPIDRSQTVSPLTESDLRAPHVSIPEYDEYPEYI